MLVDFIIQITKAKKLELSFEANVMSIDVIAC